MNKPAKNYNKLNASYGKQDKSYLQTKLTALLPLLIEKVEQGQDGKFKFSHEKFPELKVEGITISFVQEHLERAIKRQFKNQSDKHIDYLFNLICE